MDLNVVSTHMHQPWLAHLASLVSKPMPWQLLVFTSKSPSLTSSVTFPTTCKSTMSIIPPIEVNHLHFVATSVVKLSLQVLQATWLVTSSIVVSLSSNKRNRSTLESFGPKSSELSRILSISPGCLSPVPTPKNVLSQWPCLSSPFFPFSPH